MKSTNDDFHKKRESGYVFDINISKSDVEMKIFRL